MRRYTQFGLKRGCRHFGSDASAKSWEDLSHLAINIRLRVNTQKSGAEKLKKPRRLCWPQTKWWYSPFRHRLRLEGIQSEFISVGLGRKEVLLRIFAGMAYENVHKDWAALRVGQGGAVENGRKRVDKEVQHCWKIEKMH